MHANELLENFDVEFFAVKHEGKVNLNTYIGIVLTMKSYQLVSCCCKDKDKTLFTLCQHQFFKSQSCLVSALSLLSGNTPGLNPTSVIPEL